MRVIRNCYGTSASNIVTDVFLGRDAVHRYEDGYREG